MDTPIITSLVMLFPSILLVAGVVLFGMFIACLFSKCTGVGFCCHK